MRMKGVGTYVLEPGILVPGMIKPGANSEYHPTDVLELMCKERQVHRSSSRVLRQEVLNRHKRRSIWVFAEFARADARFKHLI